MEPKNDLPQQPAKLSLQIARDRARRPRPSWPANVVEGRCPSTGDEGRSVTDALAQKLDGRLREWKPEIAAEARERITEVIELADHDILDIARSHAAEQEALKPLDEPRTR